MANSSIWLALMIGNSRLHWAWFQEEKLQAAWDTPHLPAFVVQQLAKSRTLADFPAELFPPIASSSPPSIFLTPHNALLYAEETSDESAPLHPTPLYVASVVPSQTALWQVYPDVHIITLEQIPLQGVYPTLGIDRALALWGAGETWGFPVLVIDAGTALTFTGADASRRLVGGAILPGLGLQLQSLAQRTANLPSVDTQRSLPQRWALNTPEAIQSGVVYTIIAGVRDFIEAWWQEFPESCICMTGGDGELLLTYLRSRFPEFVGTNVGAPVLFEPHVIFWGMRVIRNS